ncbi:MAG: TetR/AcrR family transcriptional regulator [Clostridiales bacterium]|nr:TetR/AcrR family transcriptional regulator [Clostridiales bacterium]
MAKKQPETTANTKQNIMDAYWELYSSDTAGKITVKMITDRAGYNRGTFYAYFLDIEDLHNQLEDELLPSEENFEKLRQATLSKNSKEILEIFMEGEESYGEKLSYLLGSAGSLSFQNKLKKSLRKQILKYLRLDLDEPDRNIDYKTELFCAMFYETLRYWYERGEQLFTREEMLNLMLEVTYNGLATKKN